MKSPTPAMSARLIGGPAGQSGLREHNLGLITGLVFASPDPIPRSEVAARTGLARATVSRLSQELIESRVLAELAPAGALACRIELASMQN